MSIANSTNLVTNGLRLYYDFGNRNKSYIGEPTTNQFAIPTPSGDGSVTFQVQGAGTFYRITTGTYGGYDIQPNDVVYKFTTSASGQCWYHGNDVTITAGQYATWSFDYYVDPSITGYVNTNYLANFEGVVSGGISDPTPSVIGQWKTITYTTQASSTGTCRMLLYPGSCGGYLASGGFVLFKNPQVTFTSYQLPFTQGTRSASGSLLDTSNNRSTSTFNVTYPSGATPLTYNFLNSYGTAVTTDSSSILDTDTHSIFFMIRFNTTSTYGSNGYSGSWDKIFSFNAGGSDRSPGIWRWPSQRYLHWRYDPGNSGTDFGKNSSNQDFDIDTWYYVGVTKNGANTVMYVNGLSVGTGTVSSPKTAGSAAVQLFEYYPTGLASMGLIQIYNRVLSSDEVFTNFAGLRGRFGI